MQVKLIPDFLSSSLLVRENISGKFSKPTVAIPEGDKKKKNGAVAGIN